MVDKKEKGAECGVDRAVIRHPPRFTETGAVVSAGRDRISAADERLAAMQRAAAVPASASPAIIPSPARGPMRVSPQFEITEDRRGPKKRFMTRDGFHPVTVSDAFDLMELQARRRDPKGAPLFTLAQVTAGRAFAALSERVASEGVRCGSGEALGRAGGGSGDRDWIEGVMARSHRLARMKAAIGDVPVIAPKAGHGVLAGTRRLTAVRLVQLVAISGMTLTRVLRSHGVEVRSSSRAALRLALQGALDRLEGV